MALDFPSNPIEGQVYNNFYYDSIRGIWKSLGRANVPNILNSPTINNAVIIATAPNSTTVPLTVKGAASQSAALQEWKNSAGTTLSSINASGQLTTDKLFNSGFDLSIGTGDQVSRGNSGASRALVKMTNNRLFINYGSDFTGGVVIDSDTSVSGKLLIPNQPAFSATANYGTNYAGSLNPIVFGIVNTNIGGNYNSSNGRFTAPVAGNYFFMSHGHRNANNGYTTIRIRKNGTMFSNAWNASAGSDTVSCGGIINLAANDYVDVQMETSQNNYMAEDYWKFMGHLVG